ncbi:hypothetical protein [Spartinivicinus poritis]|uniref:Uncharacterized protein n=1 Tax=Spartinivicinus poritis TaxID=2994640 RepID=A0ABT5UFT4_9GAMM|nr:hypothetical protein [Spartinivicinus sp. A2-2]MDE1465249.1 hypothetical protein [Spartinivicinus sp. A2-2]
MGETVHTRKIPETVELASGNGYFSSSSYTIAFAKKGYQQQSIMITSTDGWYFGNLFLGGLIGMLIVDPLTGAMFKLQDTAQVDLIATSYQSNNRLDKTLQVVSLNNLPEEYRSKLVKIN